MPTMKAIKGRIKSVKSTQQITSAMNLVATSKLGRARDKLRKERAYSDQLRMLLARIAQDMDLGVHPYLSCAGADTAGLAASGAKHLVVLVTGDRGLCGGYNSNVCKTCHDLVKDVPSTEFVCIGTKGRDYYIRRNKKILATFAGVTESPLMSDAVQISDMVFDTFKAGSYDCIHLAYTKFNTVVSYEPAMVQLLPLDTKTLPVPLSASGMEVMSFEPGDSSLVEYAVQSYIEAIIFNALCESAAAQLASKMVSMETATDNAEKMISSLTLTYNRARQAKITQELTEIVAGANALK